MYWNISDRCWKKMSIPSWSEWSIHEWLEEHKKVPSPVEHSRDVMEGYVEQKLHQVWVPGSPVHVLSRVTAVLAALDAPIQHQTDGFNVVADGCIAYARLLIEMTCSWVSYDINHLAGFWYSFSLCTWENPIFPDLDRACQCQGASCHLMFGKGRLKVTDVTLVSTANCSTFPQTPPHRCLWSMRLNGAIFSVLRS